MYDQLTHDLGELLKLASRDRATDRWQRRQMIAAARHAASQAPQYLRTESFRRYHRQLSERAGTRLPQARPNWLGLRLIARTARGVA